ncbi:MAG: hypothetical protein GFH27_549281n350 [Chloroflexi bacterium AL-W]|nr:hypothetical protein [Chloroflexi bacterium AL-N1]NOK66235.1 hypothetical protein [Chloroflexi bacterium AL-N10]NOK73116.1 hypothetical protein [Chloroflexi bacterium AL-N5]NOK80013.1 hypothetical protein [Chloroflexi bacterium AL-W]NOK88131.1 hypothetical protein [Chloroflexi bacterium AL-N15]
MYSQTMYNVSKKIKFLDLWHSGLLRRIWQYKLEMVIFLVVIEISLLGPLMCIFHCHVLSSISNLFNPVSGTHNSYFCSTVSEMNAKSFLSIRTSVPFSVQPLVLIGILTIGPSLLLLSRVVRQLQIIHTQTIVTPPTPPPRFV